MTITLPDELLNELDEIIIEIQQRDDWISMRVNDGEHNEIAAAHGWTIEAATARLFENIEEWLEEKSA